MAEAVGLNENIVMGSSMGGLDPIDNPTVSELVSVSLDNDISVSDSMTLTEGQSGADTLNINVRDSITTNDTPTVVRTTTWFKRTVIAAPSWEEDFN